MTRPHLPTLLDVVLARLDGRPHRMLRAAVWVRALPRRVARRACRRREDRARLATAARQALIACAAVNELGTAFAALAGDYYGTAAPDGSGPHGAGGQPRAYTDAAVARIQDRKRRIKESGLRLVKGGES